MQRTANRSSLGLVLFLFILLIPVPARAPIQPEGWKSRYYKAFKKAPDNIERRLPDSLIVKAVNALVYYAEYRDLSHEILFRLLREESEFEIYAYNRSSEARGLLQLTRIALIEYCRYHPTQWKILFYVDEKGRLIRNKKGHIVVNKWSLYDPKVNIKVGTWLLAKLKKDYKGDVREALIAYNAGSGRLAQIRFAEGYADRILNEKESYFTPMEIRLLLILAGVLLVSLANLYWTVKLKIYEARREAK